MNDDQVEKLRLIAVANATTAQMLLRLAGMQAENEIRIQRGESLAYDEKAFSEEDQTNYIVSHLLNPNS